MSEQDPSITNLPEKPEITRRDFVGGTLVGTGTALLAMASPGAVRTAQAQTVLSKMTGLGPDWTGPGGIVVIPPQGRGLEFEYDCRGRLERARRDFANAAEHSHRRMAGSCPEWQNL